MERFPPLPRRAPDRSHDVFLRFVMNALSRIESKTVEMKFLDPVASIGDEEFADWSAIFPIEINRIAPFVFALAIDVIVRVNAEIISVGSEVIVNDVEESRLIRGACARSMNARKSSGVP